MKAVIRSVVLVGVCLAVSSSQARAADPTTAECLGASEASLALRNQYKLREARARLLVCSDTSCPEEIRDECVRRVREVNAAMPTIVFEAKDGAGNDLSAVTVTMDGEPFAERLNGAALSLDPGDHVFKFEAAGQPVVKKTFVIREAEKGRRERIVIAAPAAAADPLTPAPGDGSRTRLAQIAAPRPSADLTSRGGGDSGTPRALTWVAFGGSAALLATGIIGQVSRSVAADHMKSLKTATGSPRCFFDNSKGIAVGPNNAVADPDCSVYGDRYNTSRSVMLVGYVGAGALAVTGVILLLTQKSAPPSSLGSAGEASTAWSCTPTFAQPGMGCAISF